MPTNRRILSQDAAAATGDANSAQGLVLHLDANDEDSIESGGANQGNGSGTWFDISTHDLNVPLVDKASNLKLHLNASDTTSYGGSGSTWTDISGSGVNGAINGATFESDTRGYFHFDGTDDTITLTATDSSPINFSSETHTVEFWVNFDNLSNDDVIVGKFGGSNTLKSFQIQVSSTNKLTVLERDGGNNHTYETTGTFSTGVWTHFAYTRSASTIKLYINGTLDKSDTASNAINAGSTQDITIGNQAGASVYFDGRMSVLRIYNTTLTDSEVAQNFRADCFLSYDSIYSTNLQMHLDAGDETTVSASTWSDKANSFDGTFTNFSSTLTDFYDKELGNFISFDGSNDHIKINNTALTKSDGKNFTVEAWVNHSGNIDYIASNTSEDGNDQNWLLRFQSNQVKFFVYGSNSFQSTSATFSANTWHHIVALIESDGTQLIYVNGKVEANAGSGQSADTTSYNTFIGSLGSQQTTNAEIGQVRIYHTALTSAQVAQNYLATKNNYPNGNHATINGATFNSGTPSFLRLDGINDKITTGFTNPKFEEMTITGYVRFDDATPSGTQTFITDTPDANEYKATFHITLNTNGNFFIHIGDGSSATNGSANLIASGFQDDTWCHIAFTLDGINDTLKYYKNGSLSSTIFDGTANKIGTHTANTVFTLGAFGSSHFADMDWGQFKIFNKTLSASEVLAEYNATKSTYGL